MSRVTVLTYAAASEAIVLPFTIEFGRTDYVPSSTGVYISVASPPIFYYFPRSRSRPGALFTTFDGTAVAVGVVYRRSDTSSYYHWQPSTYPDKYGHVSSSCYVIIIQRERDSHETPKIILSPLSPYKKGERKLLSPKS